MLTSDSSNNSNSNYENWSIQCIPDSEDIEPPIEELEAIYAILEKDNIPELQWKCPGRTAPSPVTKEEHPKIQESVEKETPIKTDFDFMDDVSLPQMRVRTQNSGPKGSAKKKTANFAVVLEALKKQHLPQNKESGT